jgi:proteasomal ATPase-associated factor 1
MMTAGRGKFTPINALSVGVVGQSNFHRRKPHGEEIVHEEPVSLHEKEVETSDKLVFCALSDGRFEVYDLRTKSSVYLSKAPSRSRAGLTAISYDANRQILATGSMDGVVSLYDTRNLSQEDVPDGSEVLTSFVRNPTPVEDLSIIAREGELDLAVATADGLPYVVSVAPNGPVVSAELVGSDCDAVRAVKADTSGTFVWSAGDDSIVRKYERW